MSRRSTSRGQARDGETLRLEGDAIDSQFGFDRYTEEGGVRLGWLLNFVAITMPDENGNPKSGLDMYFLDREGSNFKATILYDPYFYVVIKDNSRLNEICQHLEKKFETCKTMPIQKEDLDLANHLSGKKNQLIKLSFSTVKDLMDVKSELRRIVAKNTKRDKATVLDEHYLYEGEFGNSFDNTKNSSGSFGTAPSLTKQGGVVATESIDSNILELREYDVPYTMRCVIDLNLRVGGWHDVKPITGSGKNILNHIVILCILLSIIIC
jgi:DNA polymerase epsilon subunit 1